MTINLGDMSVLKYHVLGSQMPSTMSKSCTQPIVAIVWCHQPLTAKDSCRQAWTSNMQYDKIGGDSDLFIGPVDSTPSGELVFRSFGCCLPFAK